MFSINATSIISESLVNSIIYAGICFFLISFDALKRRSPAIRIYPLLSTLTVIGVMTPFSLIDAANSSRDFLSNIFLG